MLSDKKENLPPILWVDPHCKKDSSIRMVMMLEKTF